jgi:hypothetical protein
MGKRFLITLGFGAILAAAIGLFSPNIHTLFVGILLLGFAQILMMMNFVLPGRISSQSRR